MNDKKEITIPIEEYEQLLKHKTYVENWAWDIVECPKCGNLNHRGYVCITCGYEKDEDSLEIKEK